MSCKVTIENEGPKHCHHTWRYVSGGLLNYEPHHYGPGYSVYEYTVEEHYVCTLCGAKKTLIQDRDFVDR